MTDREQLEYQALRTTIGARSATRVWVFVAGLAAWAALVTAVVASGAFPAAVLLPLTVLAGTFEAIFALHVSVERIGRYLQLFCDDRWEQTVMALGAPLAGTGTDPLFLVFFGVATLLNFGPVVANDPLVPAEFIVLGAAHLLFLARLAVARHAASRQRTADLDRFQQLKRHS